MTSLWADASGVRQEVQGVIVLLCPIQVPHVHQCYDSISFIKEYSAQKILLTDLKRNQCDDTHHTQVMQT